MANYNDDKEILDYAYGGTSVREMSAIAFLSFVSDKVKGLNSYKAATQEVLAAISNPPVSRQMPESVKLRLFRKLVEAEAKL